MAVQYDWIEEAKAVFFTVKDKVTGKDKRVKSVRKTIYLHVTVESLSGEPIKRVFKGYLFRGEIRIKLPKCGILDKEQSVHWLDFPPHAKSMFGGRAAEVMNEFANRLATKKQAA